MKVLHILSGLTGGGAELAMARLAARLQREGVESVVVCLGPSGPAEAQLHAAGIDIHFLNLRNPLDLLRGLYKLAQIGRTLRPNLIQGWMYQGSLAASVASALCGYSPPVVWSIRQTLPNSQVTWRERAVLFACRVLSSTPASIVYNSHAGAVQAALFGFETRRASVISNGVDTEKFRPLTAHEKLSARHDFFNGAESPKNETRVLVCAAGRSHPMKDHEGFIRAAALVAQQIPDAGFLLVGRGLGQPLHPLRTLTRDLGLGPRFIFSDESSAIERCLGMVDVVVSSSAHSEGFPNVIAEAMACGVPCVGTDVGDTCFLIGDAGITVPPRDPRALAVAITHILSLPPEAHTALGHLGRRRILEHFPLDEKVHKHSELYHSLVSGASA